LHIGEMETAVVAGAGAEGAQVLMLAIGSLRTSREFFKHHPPLPLELENAIMAVEDEVTRARGLSAGSALLYSTDESVFEIARLAGCPDALSVTLTLEQVERLFDQLAARSEGRLASQVDIPDDPHFAASLLILREFMHHLNFDKITLTRGA
jgi:exopolyphosphatase/pppGpp-phosphohydrolase